MTSPSSAGRIAGVLVATALIGGLAWGGAARPPATLVLAALGAAALVLALADGASVTLTPAALPLALLAAGCLVQLVPVPPAVKATLSPVSASIQRRVLAGIADPGAWRPLTADPGATVHAAALLAGLAALSIALSGWTGERRREQLRGLLLATVGVMLAVALLGMVGVPLPHAIRPIATSRGLPFPLVNPNHAAAMLALVLPLAIAIAARGEGGMRLAAVVLAVAGNAALLATLSRAGIAVGLSAEAATAYALLDRRRSRRASWVRGLDVLPAAALVVALFVAAGPLVARFQTRAPEVRFGAWRDALAMLRDHLLVGAGRGAFPEVFARYNSAAARYRFGFVENGPLQVAVDFGVPLLLALAAALVVAGRWAAASLATPSLRTRAAVVGLVALLAHNLVDFSLEMGAVAAAACAMAALAFPSAGRPLSRRAAAAIATAALALVGAAALPMARTADDDEARLVAAVDADASREDTEALARAVFVRHPADGYLADVAAARLLELSAPETFDWLDRALLDGPRDVRAHQLTARALAWRGHREQAAGELHVALDEADGAERDALCKDALALLPRPEDAAALVEALPLRPDVLRTALSLLGERRRWREVERLGAAALDDNPDNPDALRWLVTGALETGDKHDLAVRAAHLVELDSSTEAALLGARAFVLAGDAATAEKLLGDELARSGSADAAVALSELAAARGDAARAGAVLDEGLARAVATRTKARLHRARGDLEERLGHTSRAAVERTEARRLDER